MNKKKIAIIGKSNKFIKILKSLYPNSQCAVYSWRFISNLNYKKILFKADIIFICGYNYNSQWYSYDQYYSSNVTMPIKLTKILSKKKTIIIYINTISNIKKNNYNKSKYTFSRYEFAKKELAYKLYRNFKLLKILEIPVIKNRKNTAYIHGSYTTLIILNILIYFKLIKTISINDIKSLIINKINLKEKNAPYRLKPFFLKIPRSLLLDRFLRLLFD